MTSARLLIAPAVAMLARGQRGEGGRAAREEERNDARSNDTEKREKSSVVFISAFCRSYGIKEK